MTPDELAAIEARANAATPGPWLWHDDDLWHGMTADALDAYNADPTGSTAPDPFDGKNTEDFSISWGDIIHPEDGGFIAAARQDVPALVAEVRRLWARVGELESARPFCEGDQVTSAGGTVRVIGTVGLPGAWPTCICGPDWTGEAPDERPDCPAHGVDAPMSASSDVEPF